MASAKNEKAIGIHLDVGHDSIGWAVSRWAKDGQTLLFPGVGSVLFPPDDCLASCRRAFRRQRRHVRAIRQRIARLGAYLVAEGAITATDIRANAIASPWKCAARVLQGGAPLTWPELWAVLRWYAHNRGYDGNALWSNRTRLTAAAAEDADSKEDREANEGAKELMTKFGKKTMAETFCAALGVDPEGERSASNYYFKGRKVSFDRSAVRTEVVCILRAHLGKLPLLTEDMITVITADPVTQPEALREGCRPNVPPVHKRYLGGLLFGQLAPRFDNRIIGQCPITGEKLPSKATKEFLEYRWAMLISNVRVGSENRPLKVEEIAKLNEITQRQGGFTKGEFKDAVADVAGCPEKMSNIDALMMAPDADKSLVRFPGLFALHRKLAEGGIAAFDEKVLRLICNKLFHGQTLTYDRLRGMALPDKRALVLPPLPKKNKKTPPPTQISAEIPMGRAPYARKILAKATQAVYEGKDPRAVGGVLYRDATREDILPPEKVAERTNNHLVRHRILVLLRLIRDIIHDYAESNPARVRDVTIEMARDLKDLSGLKNKEIESELTQRTAEHRKVAEYLAEKLHVDVRKISAGLIRKGRVALEMDWKCPYTGMLYDAKEVASKIVDLDHILPRSQRASDSLDSLVLTRSEVNRMKDNRTALQFIRECGGQEVPGVPNLTILQESAYKKLVESLPKRGIHADDTNRCKRRIEKLMQLTSKESGMTEGMLTQTSFITALAVQAVRGYFAACGSSRLPTIHTIQGRLTAEVRMQWKILPLLGEVDSRVLDENKELRLKQEIRGITHMHHAVDAVTIGLASLLLPADGALQALMIKRHLSEADKAALRTTGLFVFSQDQARLKPLPAATLDSIRKALAEERVMVYQPHGMSGLGTDQNTWGVESIKDGEVVVHQRKRITNEKDREAFEKKIAKNKGKENLVVSYNLKNAFGITTERLPLHAVFGLEPKGGVGKLKAIKGVLPFSENFAIALCKDGPQLLRQVGVKAQLDGLKSNNAGKRPEMLKKGTLIRVPRGIYLGVWKVASIKGNQGGLSLDMARPFIVKPASKMPGLAAINVSLATLVKNGLEILHPRLTGVSLCPTTSSISPKPDVG